MEAAVCGQVLWIECASLGCKGPRTVCLLVLATTVVGGRGGIMY